MKPAPPVTIILRKLASLFLVTFQTAGEQFRIVSSRHQPPTTSQNEGALLISALTHACRRDVLRVTYIRGGRPVNPYGLLLSAFCFLPSDPWPLIPDPYFPLFHSSSIL